MSEGFEAIDTHKINMKRITKNIAIVLLGIVVWLLSAESYAQCKVDNSSLVKGEFNINTVSVKGDGGGIGTASNNIPIKICEGELINLKSTLPVNSFSNVNYWIIPLSNYNGLAAPPSNVGSVDDGYTPGSGNSVDIKMILKTSSDPQGFRAYSTAGKYVITQYDNSDAIAGGPDRHHACQVIEIVKIDKPNVTYNICNSNNEVKLTFPVDPANHFDDYSIQYFQVPASTPNPFQPPLTLPITYPLTVSSGNVLSGFSKVNIEIKPKTATNGCIVGPNETFTINNVSLNSTVISAPTIVNLQGTTIKGEFKLAVSPTPGVDRHIYMRPVTTNLYDYTNYKVKNSTATTGADTVVVKVPNGDDIYCFEVEAVDKGCGSSTFVSNPLLRSNNQLCTTPITVVANDNKNTISWKQALGGGIGTSYFQNYTIQRYYSDGTPDPRFSLSPILNPSTVTIDDPDVTCGFEYVYKVTTKYPLSSSSQLVKVKAISNTVPDKITRVFADVDKDAKIRVQGQFGAGLKPINIKPNAYKFFKSNAQNGIFSLASTGPEYFDDLTANSNKESYCYYMTWTNLCNVESLPSDKICSVHLSSNGSNVKWTPEPSISLGTDSYIVYRIDPNTNAPITSNPVLATVNNAVHNFDTRALDESYGQEIYVRVETKPVGWTSTGGNVLPTTTSNTIKLFRPATSFISQIFTPNGDSMNDKFIVRGMYIKNLKMSIYDRWGNVIFYEEMSSYPYLANQNDTTVVGWNGIMNNGNKAIEGSYAYKIEIEDTIGQTTYKEGALLLAY